MNFLYAFLVGGSICTLGQILYDNTKLSSPKILVIFVVAGVVLSSVGLYDKLIEIGGGGATIPITGFGHLLFQGVKNEMEIHPIGILTGGLKAASAGLGSVIIFSFVNALIFNPRAK